MHSFLTMLAPTASQQLILPLKSLYQVNLAQEYFFSNYVVCYSSLSTSSVNVMRLCVLPHPCSHSKGEKGEGRKLTFTEYFLCVKTLYQVINVH